MSFNQMVYAGDETLTPPAKEAVAMADYSLLGADYSLVSGFPLHLYPDTARSYLPEPQRKLVLHSTLTFTYTRRFCSFAAGLVPLDYILRLYKISNDSNPFIFLRPHHQRNKCRKRILGKDDCRIQASLLMVNQRERFPSPSISARLPTIRRVNSVCRRRRSIVVRAHGLWRKQSIARAVGE
jgi:hypothetical protein